MSRNRRRDERSTRRLPVNFWRPGEEDKRQSGYTNDISTSGMYISTNRPLPPGSRIRVAIGPVDRGFLIEGKVVRVLKVDTSMQSKKIGGMGIRFVPVKELILGLVPELKSGVGDPPTEDGVFRLRYASPQEFLDIYERDLRTGGLFVPTETPAAMNAEIYVELMVLSLRVEPLRLPVRVVHRFAPTFDHGVPSAQVNLMSGMGVEVIDFGSHSERIEAFVARCRG